MKHIIRLIVEKANAVSETELVSLKNVGWLIHDVSI
jgi:hypothetical protein